MPVLKYLSAIRFSDADAGDFLQNQLSADVLALATGESTFACYCEPKGRVLALMLVYRLEEAFLALLSSELAQPIADRMRIYVMRSKVSIGILNECAVSGSQAQTSTAEDSALAKIPIPGSENHFVLLEQELAGDSDASAQRAWKAAEFQSGVTWLNSDSSGEFIPQMLGFDQIGAVNFRKGCYPGQEIVARTHYLGKVKRHPRVLNIEPAPCPASLQKVQLLSAGQSHDAIVADCAQTNDRTCLFVVTRLPPESTVQGVELDDLIVSLQ